MDIINYNQQKKLRAIVEEKAKYQKVMLLFDNTASEKEINEIYELIKDLCIFNKAEISNVSNEIYNGYRLLIYLCSANSYLMVKFQTEEFVNVFLPTDATILPFCLQDYKVNNLNGYLILPEKAIDINVMPSVAFNSFYSYLKNLINQQQGYEELNFFSYQNLSPNVLQILNLINSQTEFIDLQILTECGIEYNHLPIVDYLLISAFSVWIEGVKNRCLSMVDVYKVAKDDSNLIDKFYAISTNILTHRMISLNVNCLNTIIEKTKLIVLESLQLIELPTTQEIEQIIDKIKHYAKTSQGLLLNLYFYNVFSA